MTDIYPSKFETAISHLHYKLRWLSGAKNLI